MRAALWAAGLVLAWAGPALAQGAASPAEEALKQGTTQAFKNIANESLLGSICVILMAAIGGLCLYIKLRQNSFEAALEKRDKAHTDALEARDAAFRAERIEWQSQLSQLQEQRIALMREVLTALGNSTAAISVNSQSIAERTASAQALSKEIAELISASSSRSEHFKSVAGEVKQTLTTMSEALVRLSYGHRPTGGQP